MEETIRKARNDISKIGLIFVLFSVLNMSLLAVLTIVLGTENVNIYYMGFISATFISAFAACCIMKKFLLVSEYEKVRISFPKILSFFLICVAFAQVGSLFDSLLSYIVVKNSTVGISPLTDNMYELNPLLAIVSIVIFTPIVEELLYRKFVIDRLDKYGDSVAILVTGIFYGLFYLKFNIMFYSFALSCVYGYVYIKTRKVIYPIILHSLVNITIPIIKSVLLMNMQFESIMSAQDSKDINKYIIMNLDKIKVYGVYVFGVLLIIVMGLILVYMNRRSIKIRRIAPFVKATVPKVVFLNIGMIVYIVFSLINYFVN